MILAAGILAGETRLRFHKLHHRRCPSTLEPLRRGAAPEARRRQHPAPTEAGSLQATPAFLCKHCFLNRDLHFGSGSPGKPILRDLGSSVTSP